VLTSSARRSVDPLAQLPETVRAVAALIRGGWTSDAIRGQIRARRWQRIGRAVVLHNGPPTQDELRAAALINVGPRAVLTAFTALQAWGLRGWERDPVHVLIPRGARVRRPSELDMRIHYTDRWESTPRHEGRALHRPAAAAVLAASTFVNARPACGVLAATAQQRLARPDDLIAAVTESPRVRHRAALLAAAHDIAQGAHALSEIDFARLCRKAGLPPPSRQSIRKEPSGRRRYLDAEWDLPDGQRLVVEVDGALHLTVERWWGDQLRQNEIAIVRDVVLRYPSVIVRCEQKTVIEQLTRVLLPTRAEVV
jgi:hypothetical protein